MRIIIRLERGGSGGRTGDEGRGYVITLFLAVCVCGDKWLGEGR